ncbi:hypothetical protein KAR91_60935, partial [Candidatus Pacearchaeota archaeon]|nr:hypothetical protein [Candidatus Pacearchaeota archaeon]
MKLTTEQVRERLHNKYSGQGVIMLDEVRSTTGFGGGCTTADALVFNLWPSRGLEIHGFEIKVTRNDLLKELQRPTKAENISQYCDRWWLVVGDASIVKLAELPPYWGLMAPYGNGLSIKKSPVLQELKPIGRDFFMSIVRSMYRQNPEAQAMRQQRQRGYDEGFKEGTEKALSDMGEAGEIIQAVQIFEKASGLKITSKWRVKNLGETVRALQD